MWNNYSSEFALKQIFKLRYIKFYENLEIISHETRIQQ